MNNILVAGVGNIFMGDDGFGCEVARRLAERPLPEGTKLVDFGIRGIDLTYALMDDFDGAIIIDTAQRDEEPGTVTVVIPEVAVVDSANPEDLMLEPHSLDPAKVLRFVEAMGGGIKNLVLVACEPQTFGGDDGALGLSPAVAGAVDEAVATVERLVGQFAKSGAWPGATSEPVTG